MKQNIGVSWAHDIGWEETETGRQRGCAADSAVVSSFLSPRFVIMDVGKCENPQAIWPAGFVWQGRRDSNTQPTVLETVALPLSHSPKTESNHNIAVPDCQQPMPVLSPFDAAVLFACPGLE